MRWLICTIPILLERADGDHGTPRRRIDTTEASKYYSTIAYRSALWRCCIRPSSDTAFPVRDTGRFAKNCRIGGYRGIGGRCRAVAAEEDCRRDGRDALLPEIWEKPEPEFQNEDPPDAPCKPACHPQTDGIVSPGVRALDRCSPGCGRLGECPSPVPGCLQL